MKPKDAKSRRTAPLNTPTDLGANATKDLSGALNILLADLFALSGHDDGAGGGIDERGLLAGFLGKDPDQLVAEARRHGRRGRRRRAFPAVAQLAREAAGLAQRRLGQRHALTRPVLIAPLGVGQGEGADGGTRDRRMTNRR